MKSLPLALPSLLISIWFSNMSAQEVATKWDVEIPDPITDGSPSKPAPKPAPLDLKVLSSRTTRMDVKEAPEMPDLPPITGTINVTVQLVENPNLPDPPPPLPALPPDDPAVLARLAKLRESYRGTQLVFLSATVYDHHRTFLRIYPNGKTDDQVTAWSNLDFNHFCGFSTYRVTSGVDGTIHDYGLLMGIGSTRIASAKRQEQLAAERGYEYKALEIPLMPNLAAGGPAFVVVEGDKSSPAMDTLEQIHDLYRREGMRMEQAYHAREKARAERKAYLLANPPVPQDVTTWITRPRRHAPAGGDTGSK